MHWNSMGLNFQIAIALRALAAGIFEYDFLTSYGRLSL
jgi:hypothetical protein